VLRFKNYLKSRSYSPSSIYNLPNHVREFLHFQEQRNRKLNDWQQEDFSDFLDYMRHRSNQRRAGALTASYLNKIIQALNLLQRYLKDTHQVDFYYKLRGLNQTSSELQVFSPAEIQQLYDACKSNAFGMRMRAVLGLCYGCGLRKGEAVALNLNDLWWDKQVLQVRKSKTGKSRLVPLARGVERDLKTYLHRARTQLARKDSPAAFLLNQRGGRLSGGALYKAFEYFLQRNGFRQTGLHTLRHSIASHLTESGMPSEQLARFLGHSTLDSTQIYVHFKD